MFQKAFALCKENQPYVQEGMTQIDIWTYYATNSDLFEIYTK